MNIVIRNVDKAYKEKHVINNFSLEINSGECVGLIGPNGAGKSTMMKMITGIIHQDSGKIQINNQDISKVKGQIGYLPQNPTFYEWMTVEGALLFIGKLSGISTNHLKLRIKEVLYTVGLVGNENDRISSLSGGMKQRLGIAQAILHKPNFLVLDEPVSALDPIGRRQVINLIQEIKKNTTILLSTHILSDAEEICDRFVVLKEGKIVTDTNNEVLYGNKFQNTLSIELVNDDSCLESVLNKEPYIKTIAKKDNKFLVEVSDINKDKFELVKVIHDRRVNFKRIEIYKENLEDIFLDLVVEK